MSHRIVLTDVQLARAQELKAGGEPAAQIAQQLNVSRAYIQRLLARFPPRYGRPQRRPEPQETGPR